MGRHVYLLQKVQANRPLTGAELKELEKYEDEMKKKENKNTPPAIVSLKAKKTKRRGGKTIKRPAVVSATDIKLAATQGLSVTQAETQLGVSSLNKLFAKQPQLKQAWERGTFLKNIAEFGGKNYTIAEAESELGLDAGQLDKIFLADFEASNTWNQARLKTLLAIKGKWLEMVGMASPSALKQLEKLMRREIAHREVDFTRLTTNQMMEITGKTRQTLQVEWPEKGLSRNSDGTYNLAVFLRWFEEYLPMIRPAPKSISQSQDEKARKYKLDNDERTGRLIERTKVITGLVARGQNILGIFQRTIDSQKDPFLKQSLEKIIEDIRREISKNIIEMKLDEKQSLKLRELLDSLEPTEEMAKI